MRPIDLVQSQSSCMQGVCSVCDIVPQFNSFGCTHNNACFLMNIVKKNAVMGDKERPIAPFREEDRRQQLCSPKSIQGGAAGSGPNQL